jgi:hypothetical protein
MRRAILLVLLAGCSQEPPPPAAPPALPEFPAAALPEPRALEPVADEPLAAFDRDDSRLHFIPPHSPTRPPLPEPPPDLQPRGRLSESWVLETGMPWAIGDVRLKPSFLSLRQIRRNPSP